MLCLVIGLAMAVNTPVANEANAVKLTNDSAMYWERVKPDEALRSALAAVQMWEQIGQTGRREYLVAINNVITAELLRGSVRETEPLVRKARDLYLHTLSQDDPMLPLSLMVLGAAYKALGNYAEAGTVADQALRLAETQKAAPPLISKLKSGLGDILGMQGRLPEAQQMLRDAVSLPVGESDSDIVNRAAAYRSLGGVERHLGQYPAAEADDLRGLRLIENRHGQADLARGQLLNELGVLEEDQKNWKQAQTYLTQAVHTFEEAFGAGHPNISPAYADLAGCYLHHGQFAKAEALYKRALAAETAAFPPEHPAIARDLNNLGSLEFKRRRYAEAENLFSRATQIMEHTLGSASADTGLMEANLANTLFELKRYREARDHYVHALDTLDRCWGEDDPRLLDVLSAFAAMSRAHAEPAEAEKLETRMEHIRVRQAINREQQQPNGRS
jgi:tetratricopeptide (TPR) repeat protein